MVSYTSTTHSPYISESAVDAAALEQSLLAPDLGARSVPKRWMVFAASVFLISVPVFIQAPLVQLYPWVSLLLTPVLFGFGRSLRSNPTWKVWGDLLIGFTWTWLAGSVYWGWLRWEPYFHLPVEAIGLPFVLFTLGRSKEKIGDWFYLGSLLGTALTDLYFYWVDLIPHWRQLIQVIQNDPTQVGAVFHAALNQMYTPWGMGAAVVLLIMLLGIGCWPLRSPQLHWWAFSGAVLSTILVDGLFWLAATVA